MKRFFAIVLIIVAVIPASAQKRIDPNLFTSEVSGGVGFRSSFRETMGNGADPVYWLNYSQYYNRYLGLRVGAEYMPEALGVENYMGFPIAFSMRTGMRQTSDAMFYGGVLAFDLLDSFIWNDDNIFAEMLAVFLLAMVNRAEFHIGLTPGYVFGGSDIHESYYWDADGNKYIESYGTRKAASVYCTADAGVNLSWRIWRFTLNMTPTFHYNITGNFHQYSRNEQTVYPQDTPLRWRFSMNFGLGFLF